MKAYLIDPTTKSVNEVEYDGHGSKVADLIGAESGLFAAVRLPDDNVAYVDDEGLLINPNPHGYFRFLGIPQVFAGKALVVGTGPDGEDTEPTFSKSLFQVVTRFIDNPSPESIEPRIEVLSFAEAAERGMLPPGLAEAFADKEDKFVPLEDQLLPPRD